MFFIRPHKSILKALPQEKRLKTKLGSNHKFQNLDLLRRMKPVSRYVSQNALLDIS